MLGLDKKESKVKKTDDKKQDKSTAQQTKSTSQSDEAKAVLAQMEAKKDAGDCPFC